MMRGARRNPPRSDVPESVPARAPAPSAPVMSAPVDDDDDDNDGDDDDDDDDGVPEGEHDEHDDGEVEYEDDLQGDEDKEVEIIDGEHGDEEYDDNGDVEAHVDGEFQADDADLPHVDKQDDHIEGDPNEHDEHNDDDDDDDEYYVDDAAHEHDHTDVHDDGDGDDHDEYDEHDANDHGEDDEDEDDDEEEEEEEEDEDEDEDEPALKYQRLAADVPRIVTNDLITSFLSHEKLIVVGTDRGYVHVLDLNGNEVTRMQVHRDRVLDLSLDASAEFVGSCARDGTVVITNFYTKEQARHSYVKSILSLALPANYKQNVMFAAGGYTQQFFINSKGWFSNKDNIIHAGEGVIRAVRWRMDIVAWANDAGVKLYDVSTSELISHIPLSSAKAPIDPQHPCTLCWMADDQLLIAWSSQVWIGRIKRRRLTPQEADRGVPSRALHIVTTFCTDYVICGAAPYVNEQLLLLCFPRENLRGSDGKKPPLSAMSDTLRPELRIVTYANEEISVDALPIQGFVDCDPEDLHLDFQCPSKMHAPVYSTASTTYASTASSSLSSSSSSSSPAATSPSNAVSSSASASTAASPPPPMFTTEQLDFTFFIVAPHDVIIARPRDVDDHVSWLLTRGDFPKALDVAHTYATNLKLYKLSDISEKFLTYLLENGDFEAAANECVKLLGNNKALWEKWILLFAKYEQLAVIRPRVPTKDPQLSEEVYELILQYYLVADPDGMLSLIKEWSHHLYNIDRVIRAVIDRLTEVRAAAAATAKAAALQQRRRDLAMRAGGGASGNGNGAAQDNASGADGANGGAAAITTTTTTTFSTMSAEERSLMSVLGELYLLNKQYELAVQHLLAVGRTDVFHLVRSLDLFAVVKSKLLDLVVFDPQGAVGMFISNIDRLPAKDVIEQLSPRRDLLFVYLHQLFVADAYAAERYHDELLDLYAQYDSTHLLDFLKKSTAYTLERALQVCQEHKLYKEMVFVLRRMGNTQLALTLIIDKLRDVKQAIAFVEEHKDDQLWEELINRSLDSPEFLSNLLEHVGSHYVDLLKLIRRIPPDLEVPKLRQKLMSILTDCALHQSVLVGARTILRHDCERLQQEMGADLCKSIATVSAQTFCGVCSRRIIVSEQERELERRRERRARRLAANAANSAANSANSAAVVAASNGASDAKEREKARDMDAIVFYCQHVYHRGCVGLRDRNAKAVCPRCTSTGANAGLSSNASVAAAGAAGAAAAVSAQAVSAAGFTFESGLSTGGGGGATLGSTTGAAAVTASTMVDNGGAGDGHAMSPQELAAFYGKVPTTSSGGVPSSVASAGLAGAGAGASAGAGAQPQRRTVANLTSTLPASALSYSAARAAQAVQASSGSSGRNTAGPPSRSTSSQQVVPPQQGLAQQGAGGAGAGAGGRAAGRRR